MQHSRKALLVGVITATRAERTGADPRRGWSKTLGTTLTAVFALAGLHALDARAYGAGTYRNASSDPNRAPASTPVPKKVNGDPASGTASAGAANNSNKPVQANKSGATCDTNSPCKPDPVKGPASNPCKDCGKRNCEPGRNLECLVAMAIRGCANFDCRRVCGGDGCGNSNCCRSCQPDFCGGQPSSCTALGGTCGEYGSSDVPSCGATMPIVDLLPAPPVKIVRLVNSLGTQTTLQFTVNGQAHSLEPGKTETLELTENMVIEFNVPAKDTPDRSNP